jgi:hypothetical protein
MNIDYDAYNQMDVKELEKIVSHAKNILNLREQKVTNAFKNKDLIALKAALKLNADQKIPRNAWEELKFNDFKYEDLEFFNFCTTLPKFKENDDDPFNALSKTQQAVLGAFADKRLFDYFIAIPTYAKILKEYAQDFAVAKITSKEMIELLLSHKLLEANKDLLDTVINSGNDIFLEYFFENKTYPFSKEDYKDLYNRTWTYLSDSLLDFIKEKYPEHKDISLSDLVGPVKVNHGKDADYERYKKFLKIEQKSFIRTLNTHNFDKNTVAHLIRAFNNLAPAENEKFMAFTDLIISNHPDLIPVFKEQKSLVTSGHFKKIYEKVANYADFQIDLERKETQPSNRMKI